MSKRSRKVAFADEVDVDDKKQRPTQRGYQDEDDDIKEERSVLTLACLQRLL